MDGRAHSSERVDRPSPHPCSSSSSSCLCSQEGKSNDGISETILLLHCGFCDSFRLSLLFFCIQPFSRDLSAVASVWWVSPCDDDPQERRTLLVMLLAVLHCSLAGACARRASLLLSCTAFARRHHRLASLNESPPRTLALAGRCCLSFPSAASLSLSLSFWDLEQSSYLYSGLPLGSPRRILVSSPPRRLRRARPPSSCTARWRCAGSPPPGRR